MKVNEKLMQNLISAVDWERVNNSDTFSTWEDGEVTNYFDIELFNSDNGVSKLVLIPLDSKEHFVIKIPYRNLWDEDAYDEQENEWGAYREFEKAPFSGWDYCASEWIYYCIAKKKGLGEFFPKTILYKEHPYPIYCQEKCLPFWKVTTHTKTKEKAKEKTREIAAAASESQKDWIKGFDSNWVSDAIDWYGEEAFLKFAQFLADYNITDLHHSNYGYLEETLRPVLIDFSGFYD